MEQLSRLLGLLRELVGPAPSPGEIKANIELNRQGSVMGTERQAQMLRGRSPLRATAEDMLQNLNPMEWMGTPGASAAGFAPIVTKAQKKIVKAAYRASPEVVKEVRDLPQKLSVGVERLTGPGTELGAPSGFFRPSTNELKIDPAVMRGVAPTNATAQAVAEALAQLSGVPARSLVKTGKTSDLGHLPGVTIHEMQHFINNNRIIPKMIESYGKGQSKSAYDTAYDLSKYLPFESGQQQVIDALRAGQNRLAVDEALAYLREAATRNPQSIMLQDLVDTYLRAR